MGRLVDRTCLSGTLEVGGMCSCVHRRCVHVGVRSSMKSKTANTIVGGATKMPITKAPMKPLIRPNLQSSKNINDTISTAMRNTALTLHDVLGVAVALNANLAFFEVSIRARSTIWTYVAWSALYGKSMQDARGICQTCVRIATSVISIRSIVGRDVCDSTT